MTVSSVVVRAVAGWTGAETEFPTGIQVLAKTQLVVSLVPDEGARLPLTLGLHYAVNLSPAGVATVLPLPAFPATHGEVSFVRRTPMTQDYDPTATDTYDAAGHAAALDRSAMRVAELSLAVDDIAAASVVVEGGAASVPAGAVYVSDGAGRAIAGPTAVEIEAARVEAVGAASTATTAAGTSVQAAGAAGDAAALADQLANAAPDTPVGSGFSMRHWLALVEALVSDLDLSNYPTVAQIAETLADYTPTRRKVKTGAAFLLNGSAGTDAVPAEADLSADLLFKLIFASTAASIEGAREDLPVHPAGLKAAIDGALESFSAGGIKGVQVFTTSRIYTPDASATKAVILAVGGGGGGGTVGSQTAGDGGSGGEFAACLWPNPSAQSVYIGAGGASGSNSSAGAGGSTSVGSLISANGGAPGNRGSSTATTTPGGSGGGFGSEVIGLLRFPGGHGHRREAQGIGGKGGDSKFGFGCPGCASTDDGRRGVGFGFGGRGSYNVPEAGGAGLAIILEF
jgi:hypothetical protein